MRNMARMIGQDLRWIRPHIIKKQYVLLGKKSVVAALSFKNPFSFFATAESADGKWIFKHSGIWRPIVTIRESRIGNDIGIYKNITSKGEGTLELGDGRRYNLRNHVDSEPSRFSFEDETGEVLISYRQFDWSLSLSCHVEIHPLAKGLLEMPWMVLLGWYGILLPNDQFGGKFEISIDVGS